MKKTTIVGVALLTLGFSGAAFAETVALWDFNSPIQNIPGTNKQDLTYATNDVLGNWIAVGSGTMGQIASGAQASVISEYDVSKTDTSPFGNDSSDPLDTTTGTSSCVYQQSKSGPTAWLWQPNRDDPNQFSQWFKVSTAGKNNVHVSMDVRFKPYDDNACTLWYTLDGSALSNTGNGTAAWVPFQTYYAPNPNADASVWGEINADLSGIPGVAGNPNFAFAFASAKDPAGGNALGQGYQYVSHPLGVTGDDLNKGYDKYGFDMVEVYAGASDVPRGSITTLAAVPEPSSIALLGAGVVGLLVVVRRRRKA